VADKYDEPLYGDRSVKALVRLIERTMPEDNPGQCVGEDAVKVAEYIYDTFYSPKARAQMQPPRIQLARLTVNQYALAIADLVGSFRAAPAPPDKERGLKGDYFDSRNFNGDKRAFDRIDPRVEFHFGTNNPIREKVGTNDFAIRWRGSLLADETGDYEFSVNTENGVRVWLNGDGKALIDEWVSSGPEPREHRQTVRLLGGRAYPIQIDYFKFKDKTASLVLAWKPPHKTWETIPARHLSPRRVPETLVVTTPFPADDSSVGYERGTSVSKAWDQAATSAAIEVANNIVERLDSLAGTKAAAKDRMEKSKRFCEQFAERAFRRPLSPEQKKAFVESQFGGAKDVESAVKRSVILVLKSPRFLYPEIGNNRPDDYTVASRLSLGLWDSLPDAELLQAAAHSRVRTAEEISGKTHRMLKDSRAKAKLRDFLHHWLEMSEAEDISKDTKAFPDFDESVLADMRTSLELFLDDVVWSEQSDYRRLLTADYLFLNERLAKFMGVKPGTEDEFEKVPFDLDQRSGVITHPFLLSAFAYHKSSSPIHRGVFLTRNIMGRALKPPPMAIEFMDDRFDPSLTMREKVSELTRPAACVTCHSLINPLGFSLEHYDAVGRYRTTDNKKPVDAAGEYPTSEGETVHLKGARDVAEYAAKSEEAHRGFIQQLFHHVVKQPVAAYGPRTLEDLRRSFVASEFNIQKLLVEIVKVSAAHGTERPDTDAKPEATRKT